MSSPVPVSPFHARRAWSGARLITERAHAQAAARSDYPLPYNYQDRRLEIVSTREQILIILLVDYLKHF